MKADFGIDEDLFYAYSCEPIIVLDKSDLQKVKVAICRTSFMGGKERREWVHHSTSHTNIWDYNKTMDFLETSQKKEEDSYFNKMSYIGKRKRIVEEWFRRPY